MIDYSKPERGFITSYGVDLVKLKGGEDLAFQVSDWELYKKEYDQIDPKEWHIDEVRVRRQRYDEFSGRFPSQTTTTADLDELKVLLKGLFVLGPRKRPITVINVPREEYRRESPTHKYN